MAEAPQAKRSRQNPTTLHIDQTAIEEYQVRGKPGDLLSASSARRVAGRATRGLTSRPAVLRCCSLAHRTSCSLSPPNGNAPSHHWLLSQFVNAFFPLTVFLQKDDGTLKTEG